LARRGGRLIGELEEEDPAGEDGTKEKKRKRPSKKDLVCVCAFLLPSLWRLKNLFSLRRTGLKNKKDSHPRSTA
jgi:hypothetical protein